MNAGRAVGLLAVALAASPAAALVNPYFTPRHLVDQSSAVLVVTLKADAKAKLLSCQVVEVLKGKKGDWKGPVKIDLSAAVHEAEVDFVIKWVGDRPNPTGLLFFGPEYKEDTKEDNRHPVLAEGYLYFDGEGRWLSLYKGEAGGLEMDRVDSSMHSTWPGGTDMLLRCVRHVLADPQANIHVDCRSRWADPKKAATLAGKVAAAMPVDLADGLGQALFVACEKGDRLFAWDRAKNALADVTASRKLTSRSALAAWGDFNHDGRLDLASWDGRVLSFQIQQADGTFKSAASAIGAKTTGEVFGLSAAGVGKDGRAGLIVATKGWPLVVALEAGGKSWRATLRRGRAADGPDEAGPSSGGDLPKGEDRGRPGPCLVADLDGDGLADLLQLFQKSSLLHKGVAPGRFAPPKVCEVATGPDYSEWRPEDIPATPGRTNACLGDWDHDGLLDVLAVADDRIRVWQNRGGFKFEECLAQCGTLAYMSKPGAIAGQAADLDNDGRHDLLLVYNDMTPQLYYNRSFRWMGAAYWLFPETLGVPKAAAAGCQAGCLGDFNGDGMTDMAVVPKNGELWLFRGRAFAAGPQPAKGAETQPDRTPAQRGEVGLVVRVSVPANGPIGPVKVTGQIPNRCLGAWNVLPGSSARIGREGPGPITLKWQFPGGQPRQAIVELKDRPVEFPLKP